MSQTARAAEVAPISVTPLTPTIGAEISGVDLSKPMTPGLLAAVRQALLDWKVIFFRDQDITTEQHLAFGRLRRRALDHRRRLVGRNFHYSGIECRT
jgi:taurine dioxygenase